MIFLFWVSYIYFLSLTKLDIIILKKNYTHFLVWFLLKLIFAILYVLSKLKLFRRSYFKLRIKLQFYVM